ncbi:hypothetical protein QKU58_gp080 [Pyramimonas orientalis virus]|uniref:Uncharacterized protein n=1 Tax=Pyramimonas orientalis virus 01B TaxID=3134525 RepID=A0A7M3UNJ0_9VIRU|nr:hypothetical protein QKU58_gp080 [Pyramimonas orientalis virus]QOI90251.1 hypothetical protein HWQ62_00114 [Pyramimonas orientalis virus]
MDKDDILEELEYLKKKTLILEKMLNNTNGVQTILDEPKAKKKVTQNNTRLKKRSIC